MLNRKYPPVLLPPVKPMPMPPQDFTNQFSYKEALRLGTLFKWLYDPYYK